jgi:hypothetical protein
MWLRDPFGNPYPMRLRRSDDAITDRNKLTQSLSSFIIDKRITMNQLRDERANIQSDVREEFTAVKNVDYHLQILKRDHEESLEIANKRKLREDEDNRLRKKDTEVSSEYQKMRTTDTDLITIRTQLEANEQILADKRLQAEIAFTKKKH